MLEWLPIIVALMLTGVISGVLAGLLGVGGGIVNVPVLYFIFQSLGVSAASAMSIATATSLLIIIPTSISSIRSHHKRGNIDTGVIRFWWIFIVLGAALGAAFATRAGGVVAAIIFGTVAMGIALNMFFRANRSAMMKVFPHKSLQAGIAAVIGFISVVMGIGGGTLGVPSLSAFNLPAHKAVGTAAVFGFIIAVPGALLLLLFGVKPADAPLGTFGLINFIGFALIVPLSVAMAPAGVWLGAKLNDSLLKKSFAVFLFVSGARMIYQAAFAA